MNIGFLRLVKNKLSVATVTGSEARFEEDVEEIVVVVEGEADQAS